MLIITSKTRSRNWRTRSQQCENLRRVYGGSGGMTDENLDKCKYLEKKEGKAAFVPQAHLKEVK